MNETALTFYKVFLLTAGIIWFFKTVPGRKISDYLPTPFWVYFLAILSSTFGFLPKSSAAYSWFGLYGISLALVMILIGAPVRDLLRMGPLATKAMALTVVSMIAATFAAFALTVKFLPEESWKGAGAILATWVGGSANMIAVKEVLGMSDAQMAPLIIVDTFLSYSWMALLMAGAAHQHKFDRRALKWNAGDLGANAHESLVTGARRNLRTFFSVVICLGLALVFVQVARWLSPLKILSLSAWAILISSTAAVLLAATPARRLENGHLSQLGQWMLYTVLVTIGAKAGLDQALDAPSYFLFGALLLILHGVALFYIGHRLRLPLFLLATGSQAAVGGPISAPIVAEGYRPGTAHIGVLMAISGAVIGTYVGAAGGYLCRVLEGWIK